MKRARYLLFPARLSRTSKLQLSMTEQARPSIASSSLIRSLSTTSNQNPKTPSSSKNNRDSLILELFRHRQKSSDDKLHRKPVKTTSSSAAIVENDEKGGPKLVSGFEGLGLREELIGAAEEMGVGAPSEIQGVGIPAVLDGKCVVLSSESGSARTLAYLLPLVQLLRQEEASVSMKPKHPRAIVLCATEELSDEFFRMAKFISDHARSKGSENSSNAPIGLLVGTPCEILEQIEESYVFCNDIKYLVLDETDAMLSHGFGPMIQKIISQLQKHLGIQTILVTSPVTELLGKQLYPIMERLGKNHSGQVAAMLLEMDRTEMFDLLESADALKKKVAEAMSSLSVDAQGS